MPDVTARPEADRDAVQPPARLAGNSTGVGATRSPCRLRELISARMVAFIWGRWDRALLREDSPLNQLIIGGLLAMSGAAASQAAGIVTVVNSGRRRAHDSAARRVAEREARRRTLYEELLRTVNDALLHCAEMSQVCRRLDPPDPALGGLAGSLAERFDPLRTVAVGVMIDGSARAGQIAAAIAGALREFTQALKAAVKTSDAEGLDLAASRLSDLTALLGKAERELVAAARADFGVPD